MVRSAVVQSREATDAEEQAWQDGWRGRLQSWYGHDHAPAGWAGDQAANRIAMLDRAAQRKTFTLTVDDDAVGYLAVCVFDQGGIALAFVVDIWIAPEHRRHGYAAGAVQLAEDWAVSRGAASLQVITEPGDPAQAALFARYPVRAIQMIRHLEARPKLPGGLTGRTMTDAEFAAWWDETETGYAADIAQSGMMSAEQAAAVAAEQMRELLPAGLNTAGHSFVCLCAAGEVVATNWIQHHRWPGVSWVYGVETHEQFRGKGYGRAAMVLGEQATLDAGDAHLALNVFGQNSVAIGLYKSMRYRAYDEARSIDL